MRTENSNEVTPLNLLHICLFTYESFDRQGQLSSNKDWNHTRLGRVLVIPFLKHACENIATKI